MTTLKDLNKFALTKEFQSQLPESGSPIMLGIDIETTGLIAKNEHMLSVAVLLIDPELNPIGKGFEIIINQPMSIMHSMDEWCSKVHGESGLTDQVLNSPYTLKDVENKVSEYVHNEFKKLGEDFRPLPMMGNSIYLDRSFVELHTPEMFKLFHYRNIDISTIKELTRFMRPDIYHSMSKSLGHTALNDIYESLEELKIYDQHFLKGKFLEFASIK
jgi:oligoribonuclease